MSLSVVEALVKHPCIDIFFPWPVRPFKSSRPRNQTRLDETESLPEPWEGASVQIQEKESERRVRECERHQKPQDSPNARRVVYIHQVEHARLVPQPRCVVQIRSREDTAITTVSMGRRDDKARIADLEMKSRWADQYGHCMMEARVRFIYAR